MSAADCLACHRSTRTLGSRRLCDEHAEVILGPIRARVIADESGIGHGRRVGPWRIDWGKNFAMLSCSVCEAEWLGRIDEDCAWCVDRADRMLVDQKQRVLRPELPDPVDRRYDTAVTAWAQRLAVAAKAGIIAEFEARSALEKHDTRSVVRHAA